MAQTALKGNPVQTSGDLPAVGSHAPDFTLTGTDLGDIKLGDYKGKKVVLNIFPSIDTPVCAVSVRKFNTESANHPDTTVVCVSRDLPFAHARFCGTEGIDNVVSASVMKDPAFGSDYGVTCADGPLQGLLARAVVVIDENRKVLYTQLVPEISEEPDYAAALAALGAAADSDLDTCVVTSTAEHSRADDFDAPCDDGRAG
ncbi:MAG: thiol peroxidase [Desulfobacterales bacterium]|nr:thiol peroxidase [Desulfobacterales bacterium]